MNAPTPGPGRPATGHGGLEPPIERGSAEFSADRRRLDGTHSFWASSTTADGVRLDRWDESNDRWALISASPDRSWLDAVRGDAELAGVRADEVTDYQAADAVLLLTVLAAVGDGDATEVDFPFDVAAYSSQDEYPWIDEGPPRRYASVNGERLFFAASDGDPLPYLINGDHVDGDLTASFAWGSEAGMTSGAGGWNLIQTTPGTAVAVPLGDTSGEMGGTVWGFRVEPSAGEIARMVAAWLKRGGDYCGGMEGSTALALEPLDPSGLLTDAERAAWHTEFAALRGGHGETLRADYHLADDATTELRRILSVEGSTYKKVADALADPIGGDWLRESLAGGDLQPLW